MNKAEFPIQKEYNCDVLVVGGGVSGISSAVAAARKGASVILCETSGVLGGTATNGMVGPFMTCYDKKGKVQIIRGFYSEFVDAMLAENGAISHRECHGSDSYGGYRVKGHIGVTPFSPESLKRVAERICLEAGVRLLYHSQFVGCQVSDKSIQCAYFATPAGIEAVNAKVYIDATGHASLAEKSGAEVFFGDEDGFVQTASTFFHITGVDKEFLDDHMAKNEEMRARYFMDIIEQGQKDGTFPCGTKKLRIYESVNGVWTVNMAQENETVNDLDTEALTRAEISQREQIKYIFQFLKKNIPGLENIRMVASAANIGIRESQRMVGKTLLTGDDIVNSRYYDERIAVCANSVDVHCKNGVEYIACENNYYIPLSCLISKDVTNLLASGKCVSADKYAFSAIRVMPPCFAMGEAAGICAALSLQKDANPSLVDVKDVQAAIIENGGYLE